MIEIKIPEVIYTDNPNDCGKLITDLDKFIIGFKELCKKTNMNEVSTYKFGKITNLPVSLNFNDGTYIGIWKLFDEIGFK